MSSPDTDSSIKSKGIPEISHDDGSSTPMQTPNRGFLLALATSASFVEKVVLLCFTAVISGLLIPLILTHQGAQYAEQQKHLDEIKSRNDSIFEARSKLFEEFSDVVFSYESIALDVSWFGSANGKNPKLQVLAIERYNSKVGDLWARWRALISRARILASPKIAGRMQQLLLAAVIQDEQLIKLVNDGRTASVRNWDEQHERNREMLDRTSQIVDELGSDLGLASVQQR